MSKLIALDDGHGMQTAGKRTPILPKGVKSETGNFMHENEFNRAVVKYLNEELKRCGFRTLLVAPTDADTPLEARTKLANSKKADLYLSIHANALTGKFFDGGGIETYVYPKGESLRIGQICHEAVMEGTKFKNRGVRDGSHLWVIRKTNMPAILFELGFMDSKTDYKYLLSDAYRRECATEIAKGVCRAYGVKYVPKETPAKPASKPNPDRVQVEDTIYRVRKSATDSKTQIGAFKSLTSAKSLANRTPGYKVYDHKGKHVYTPSVVYTVKKGDSLSKIAERYKTTTKKLQDANGIKDANKINIGQKIKIK